MMPCMNDGKDLGATRNLRTLTPAPRSAWREIVGKVESTREPEVAMQDDLAMQSPTIRWRGAALPGIRASGHEGACAIEIKESTTPAPSSEPGMQYWYEPQRKRRQCYR